MVMAMPDLIAPLRREAGIFLRYSRSRPRFGLHLAIDAILSIVIVLAAFQFFTFISNRESADSLKISGAIAMSGGQLVSFLHHEKLSAYWVGPETDTKYTLIATTPGEVTITYFPKNADIAQLGSGSLVVQTHRRVSASDTEAYAQDVSGLGSFLLNQGSEGNAIHYNPATPTRVILTFKDKFEAVTIIDPTPQASLTLAMKPGVIRKIA